MSGLYPEILFHFTNLPSLKGILQYGFRPSFSKETIYCNSIINSERKFGVPIVSFCDLRLSELPFHMKKYGRYGIGMDKKWAIKNGLNPVAYITKDSNFTNSLIEVIDRYFDQLKKTESDFEDINSRENWEKVKKDTKFYTDLTNQLRYIKNYQGKLIRKGIDKGNYRFADEREWRYVINPYKDSELNFIPYSALEQKEEKAKLNEKIATNVLQFDPKDVKYIIVNDERNIPNIRNYISKLSIYDLSGKEYLTARILTAKQIESDM